MRIAITGGTGFVGGHLAAALSADGHEAVLIARGIDDRPWAAHVRGLPGVTSIQAGVNDEAALAAAFAGCDGVAHCAGINREIGAATYRAVHVDGTRNVVRAAEAAGVERLALVSFLRARPNCGSPYHESKWEAEEIVRASSLDWTVIKAGMMFGTGDHMLTHLSEALRTFPVFIGVGPRRVAPLAIDDAVAVLMAALVDSRLPRQTIPLVGPSELTFDDAAREVAQAIGVRRPFIPAPLAFHRLLAAVTEPTMTVPLISRAQVQILREGVVDATLAPDTVPEDLSPATAFDQTSIRASLPPPTRFGLKDLRWFSQGPVHVCGEGEAVIDATPQQVMEFVLDVERYREADHKIGTARYVQRNGNEGTVKHGGRFQGIPLPAVTLAFKLTPHSRLDFTGLRMPWPLRGFSGYFTCDETPEGTRVVHRECFEVGPVLGPLFDRLLGGWLKRDTAAEVQRIKLLLERTRD